MTIRQRLCMGLTVLALWGASPAHAQIRSATITGTVSDPTGAVVPGADVVVTNQDTNEAASLVTTGAGIFTAPYLAAGTYTVTVSLSGFSPFKQTGIVLTTAQTVRVHAELKVSGLDETVVVSAGTTALQIDSASVRGSTPQPLIESLPNITQNPLQYATLQAGVVGRNSTSDIRSLNSFGIGVDGRRQWSSVGVNGGRAFTNDIQLDGLPVMGGGYNEASVVPNTEGLQELRVISNNFSAEYGRGQAVIAMSTKSGTNQFRGQGTYLLRHEALDANTFQNNATRVARPPFRVHDAGGALGGPALKNRLFFFTSYHQLRHNNTQTNLMTVPTALERTGNFSKTFIRDEGGNPVPARIFDPFTVVQEGPDLYRRAEIPNAIIPNPNPFAVTMLGYYPPPNRTPDDVFNTNNYQATIEQTVRRYSSNSRLDLRFANHSFYASGGISYAEILTPRPFGETPFNGAPGVRGDKNPYAQIGDTIVLSPTTVVDVRYGISGIDTKSFSGDKAGFTDYRSFGVPAALQPYILFNGAGPSVTPNGFSGGNGGGSNWTGLSAGAFNTKRERQVSHTVAGSITKSRGRWVHKAGLEYRAMFSTYADPEQASVALPSPTQHTGGNFNFEYVTADGSVGSLTRTNAQRGVNGAAMLLGAGLWTIRPGANVLPAYAQKYFAVYSQNDWRPTATLTVNLGLRWDLQPGPTERYDRMSGWDFKANTPFGTPGAIAFPGVGRYSRNLWDTTYDNVGPRVGVSYQMNHRTVVRAGYGLTFLPSNTGYFSGPTDYGSANFSTGVSQQPYGQTPQGVLVGTFAQTVTLISAAGADPRNPQVYGIGESRFLRDFQNGRAHQFNVFIERLLTDRWMASLGYSGAISRHLMNRSFPVQNIQNVPANVLAEWRAQYIASNGTLNPSTQQVPNPYLPLAGTAKFSGPLAAQTLPRFNTYLPYPLLLGSNAAVNSSDATADYHSMQARVSRRYSNGVLLDAHYTWSRNIDSTDTGIEDGQGFNAGGNARNYSLLDPAANRRLGLSDVPHRFVASFLYELPFGAGKTLALPGDVLRTIAGGWQMSGSVVWQSGFPIGISGASDGAALARPDRVDGVDLVLPASLQGWYDGRTTITLPSGRRMTPPANTYLKYNPDAFAGRVVTTPSGRIVADQFWFGNAAQTYNDIRTDSRFNIDLSIRRTFRFLPAVTLDIGLDVMNVLNHTQFSGAYTGALGGTNLSDNPGAGLIVGTGTSNSYGTRGMATFNPRQMMVRAALRF